MNCGSELTGSYCHFCGQENLVPKETALGLVSHFVYDITHFDGKFFSSIKYLLLRPGFLAKEYMRGRRASYLNPIRMYVFTSAFFFILIFSLSKPDDLIKFDQTEASVNADRQQLLNDLKNAKDSAAISNLNQKMRESDSNIVMLEQAGLIKKSAYVPDSTRKRIKPAVENETSIMDFGMKLPRSEAVYDSAQAALPLAKRDGWVKHFIARKSIRINEKYYNNPSEFKDDFTEKFLHSLPKLMFLSLPFTAIFLSLLYFRQKRFYYVNHAILVIYIYIALYLLILLGYLFSWLHHTLQWTAFSWLQKGIVIFSLYYIYKSFRNFYEQPRAKTIFKYLLFSILTMLLFSILGIVFVLNSLLML